MFMLTLRSAPLEIKCFVIWQERRDYLLAVAKLNEELQATKATNWKLERELLETVQKKVQLSEQVEQWQVSF